MEKKIAKNLVNAMRSGFAKNFSYRLLNELKKFPIQKFHSFANDKPCLGAFLVEKEQEEKLWLLVIDWRNDNNYYLVIYPENHHSAPIAELHDQLIEENSVDLVWTYNPRKRDKRNNERKTTFIRELGSANYIVSLPSAQVSLEDFLADIFSLAAFRVAADELVDFTGKVTRVSFPEGRRIERLHKSRERDSRIVREAKSNYARQNGGALPCEVCGFNFAERYGEIGISYIEAHHIRPLSELGTDEVRNTCIEDFALVCSNCHRMLHRKRPWANIEQLQIATK